MKAVEYYEKYREGLNNPLTEISNKALSSMFHDLVIEINLIAEKRKIKSDDAAMAIIKELNQKYNAICRLINAEGKTQLKRNGYYLILKATMPELSETRLFKEWKVDA